MPIVILHQLDGQIGHVWERFAADYQSMIKAAEHDGAGGANSFDSVHNVATSSKVCVYSMERCGYDTKAVQYSGSLFLPRIIGTSANSNTTFGREE